MVPNILNISLKEKDSSAIADCEEVTFIWNFSLIEMDLIRRGWGLVWKGAMVLNKMKAISISSCDKEAQRD